MGRSRCSPSVSTLKRMYTFSIGDQFLCQYHAKLFPFVWGFSPSVLSVPSLSIRSIDTSVAKSKGISVSGEKSGFVCTCGKLAYDLQDFYFNKSNPTVISVFYGYDCLPGSWELIREILRQYVVIGFGPWNRTNITICIYHNLLF